MNQLVSLKSKTGRSLEVCTQQNVDMIQSILLSTEIKLAVWHALQSHNGWSQSESTSAYHCHTCGEKKKKKVFLPSRGFKKISEGKYIPLKYTYLCIFVLKENRWRYWSGWKQFDLKMGDKVSIGDWVIFVEQCTHTLKL